MRRVSGDTSGHRGRHRRYAARRLISVRRGAGSRNVDGSLGTAPPVRVEASGGGLVASAVAVSIADAIQSFDLRELAVHGLKFLTQTFDVAVDRAVVDVDVLAVGRVHQLIAVFDMAGAVRQRLEDQKLGYGQFDRLAAPGA